jgi:porin
MKRYGLSILFMAGATALAGPAMAQEATATASGPLAELGQQMADSGVRWRALWTDEYAANPSGGVRQSQNNVGQVYVGADFDLDKIAGIKGGSFHFTVYRDYGSGLAHNNSGTFVKQQDIYKNEFTQLHLGLVSYEQKLFDDRLDIIVGHLGSTAYFGHLGPGCFFQAGATCGIPAVLNSEAGFTLLPSATWGANVKYKTSAHTYVDFGAFEVNPYIAHTRGLVFATNHSTGTTFPIEFGYENTNLAKVAYPSEFKVGYYASTGTRNDPFFNTKGQSLGLSGGTARQAEPLRQGVWIMGDKTVWRPDPKRPENITLFGGWIQPLEDEEVMDRQIFGGALWRAPFRSRPRDTVGLNVSWFHLSDKERDFLRDSRLKAGGSGNNAANEFVAELNYGIQLNHSTRVTPNIQFIANPDNSQFAKIDFVPKNMVVFGVKLVVNLADMLGMPPQATSD